MASDLSRLRQVRSPACGSPETSSTRSLSRTPSIETTARLLMAVSSLSSGEASISTMFCPACGIGTLMLHAARPARTLRVSIDLAVAADRDLRGRRRAPWSSTRNVMVCGCPTMPKRGAETSTTRRSRSSGWPVISACTGAAKPSARGLGRHVVHAPVGDEDGAGDAVGRHVGRAPTPSAVNSRVPSVSPSAWPASTKRTSSPGMRPSRSASGGARRLGLLRAVAEILARALVDHHDGDRGQRLAVLARERRIGEREHEQRERRARAPIAPRLRDTNTSSSASTTAQRSPPPTDM